MSARELTAVAMDEGFLDRGRLGGLTPHKTMQSKLTVHIRSAGSLSIFVNTGPGKYYLRELLSSPGEEYHAAPFSAGPLNERVLVFSQTVLDAVGRFQGIAADWKPYYEALSQAASCHTLDRMHAENDDAAKQLLTYIMVRRGDGAVLCFDRGVVNRVDESLRGRSCVGFGGHVKPLAPSLFDELGVFRNAAAELTEELRVPLPIARQLRAEPERHLKVIGALNDDSSGNGLRHFAFVLEYLVPDDEAFAAPRGREKSINKVKWLTEASAEQQLVHQFEYWSQLCLRDFAPALASSTPAFQVRRPSRLARAKAVVLAGQVASGKTEASRLLQTEFGFEQINSGQVLADLLGIPPIPKTTRSEFQAAAEDFIRQPSAPRELAAELATAARTYDGRVLIDGVRHIETLEWLQKYLGAGVSLVYVHAPFDVALELYREREDPSVSVAEFAARRTAPVELDVPRLIDVADAALYNWRGIDAYLAVIRRFASQHLGGSSAHRHRRRTSSGKTTC